jgi:hypothetical protein
MYVFQTIEAILELVREVLHLDGWGCDSLRHDVKWEVARQ